MTAPGFRGLQPVRLALSAALISAPIAQADSGPLSIHARLPFRAQLRTVMPAGTVAGMRVAILQFDSPLHRDEAIAHTVTAWSDEGRRPVVRASSGGWETVSVQDGQTTWTLQVRHRQSGGSTGLLSQWLRGEPPLPAERRLLELLPPGARHVRSIGHVDTTTGAVTLAAVSELDAQALWPQMQQRLSQAGFRAESGLASRFMQPDTRLGFFRDGAAQLAVTVDGRRQPTGIVMTLQSEANK